MNGGDDAAEPVDQQVAAQDRSRGTGTVAHALERQRDEQDDDQGVEDHCGQVALCGVDRCMTFSTPSSGQGPP